MERPKKRYEGDIIDGRYRISGVIGGGGLSTVYSAVDLETGIEYALKEYLLICNVLVKQKFTGNHHKFI